MYRELQVIKSLRVKLLLCGGLCYHTSLNDCGRINVCKWAFSRPSVQEITLEAAFPGVLAALCHVLCIIARKGA